MTAVVISPDWPWVFSSWAHACPCYQGWEDDAHNPRCFGSKFFFRRSLTREHQRCFTVWIRILGCRRRQLHINDIPYNNNKPRVTQVKGIQPYRKWKRPHRVSFHLCLRWCHRRRHSSCFFVPSSIKLKLRLCYCFRGLKPKFKWWMWKVKASNAMRSWCLCQVTFSQHSAMCSPRWPKRGHEQNNWCLSDEGVGKPLNKHRSQLYKFQDDKVRIRRQNSEVE